MFVGIVFFCLNKNNSFLLIITQKNITIQEDLKKNIAHK